MPAHLESMRYKIQFTEKLLSDKGAIKSDGKIEAVSPKDLKLNDLKKISALQGQYYTLKGSTEKRIKITFTSSTKIEIVLSNRSLIELVERNGQFYFLIYSEQKK